MAVSRFSQILQQRNLSRMVYEMPERYTNSFYLSNAAFFDSTNWFLHKAYEVAFPALRKSFSNLFADKNYKEYQVQEKLENIVELLDQCNSILDVRFPVKRDNGRYQLVRGFRSHYGQLVANSSCLGGLTIEDDITRDHMKALAVLSAMKNFCMGIGISGAHGGIKIHPKFYSQEEIKRTVEQYVIELSKKGYCGCGDLIYPDINTSQEQMEWITKVFERYSGQSVTATGKPVDCGGVEGFDKAAATGALNALDLTLDNQNLMRKIGLSTGLKDKRFIIQGLGKIGKPLSLMLVEKGAICVGVKEHDAYLYDSKGIDLQALHAHRQEKGTISTYGLAKMDYPNSIFVEDCDILILAACHKSLVCNIARDVKAKVILEAADGPVTPIAHKMLTGKSKLLIPDIYACSGANVASYFEYMANLQQCGLFREDVLRFSSDVYGNILKNLSQDHKQLAVGGAETHSSSIPICSSNLTSALEIIFLEVGQEIFKNLENYNLGVDLKSAAYTVSIGNMFKNVFKQQKFI